MSPSNGNSRSDAGKFDKMASGAMASPVQAASSSIELVMSPSPSTHDERSAAPALSLAPPAVDQGQKSGGEQQNADISALLEQDCEYKKRQAALANAEAVAATAETKAKEKKDKQTKAGNFHVKKRMQAEVDASAAARDKALAEVQSAREALEQRRKEVLASSQ